MHKTRLIGVVSSTVVSALGKDNKIYKVGDAIYLGKNNIKHMKQRHSKTFNKYCSKLSQIISEPDYVGINNEDNSLEYVKIFNDHVKLVVRIAGDEKLYIRSMYTVYQSRTEFFIKSGRLKLLTKLI
ncbi:MAG: PBECR2 nuclease fold domain-containing protein [Oscillospiraceae bacterium]|nr:PBECR2 nuclease fold domain-containing protein [Oscillospiraceae bacterium]